MITRDVERPVWTMPEWMEPYRDLLQNTGGNSIEDLINDHTSNVQTNVIRAALIVSVGCQVTLLHRLRARGMLVPQGHVPVEREDLKILRTALAICDLIIDCKPELLDRVDALIKGGGADD